jgi:hypothetical protein
MVRGILDLYPEQGATSRRRRRACGSRACGVLRHRGRQGPDDRVRLGAVARQFRLEQGAEEERVAGELDDPDVAAIVEAAEPQPRAGKDFQVLRVQAVAAVVALGPPSGAGDAPGCRARS